MGHVSDVELGQRLTAYMNEVCASREPLLVTRKNAQTVVMLSLEEFESMQETLHLLRSPANAEWLLQSTQQAETGRVIERGLVE